MKKTISVIGLGKLGLPFLATFAAKGYQTIGVDIDLSRVESIMNGETEVFEPKLVEILKKYTKNIMFTTDTQYAAENSDVSFVVVHTPSQKNGSFSLKYIFQVCQNLAQVIKTKKKKHTIVITSTISPGSMKKITEVLEKESQKKIGKDFGLCYSPEFIALGQVISDLQNPDFLLIGESDSQTGKTVAQMRASICTDRKVKILRASFINSEIAKIVINTYLTAKISFGNMIARIAEKTPGANAQEIVDIVGTDSRIGTSYLKGGLAYGGPCFPRDNNALDQFLKEMKVPISLPSQIHELNVKQHEYLFELVQKYSTKKGTIGILGLTYKSETDVLDESPGNILLENLRNAQIKTLAYDPSQKGELLETVLQESSLIVIMTPWESFKDVDFDRYENIHCVIDCWNILKKIPKKSQYISLGNFIQP